MFYNHIRPCFKVLPLPLLAVVLVGSWFLHSVRGEAQTKPGGKVRELQEQRLATIRKLVDITTERYRTGQTSSDELLAATRARDDAELDLCTSNQERLAILERIVAQAKAREEQDAKLVANKLLPETSFLKAQADLLEQEIRLEQVKTR